MARRIMKYNPSLLSEAALIENFVVRNTDLQLILEIIKDNTSEANQHVLVIGPRGIGKTTLVLRVAAEIRRDGKLSQKWYPLIFSEESYEVISAGEFWLETLFHLAEQTGDEKWRQTYADLKRETDDDRLGTRALGHLLDFADRLGKRILLIVENLNMLMGDLSDKDEAWKIRHTLINEPRLMLLASATSRFEYFDNESQAMFEMFKMHELPTLGDDECNAIWKLTTGQPLTGEKIRPIRILTGGNPRLLTIIARFGAKRSFASLLEDLIDLVDDHTEYFKSQLDNLPPTERKVYLALAERWDLSTAREIATAARLDVNKTSSLLKRLENRGAVSVLIESNRKFYAIAERMYNIYYLMRRRGKPAARVKAAVKFMISMYDPESATRMIVDEACKLNPELCRDHYLAYCELIKEVRDATLRENILASTPKAFLSMVPEAKLIDNLTTKEKQTSAVERVDSTGNAELKKCITLTQQALEQYQSGEHEKAIGILDSLIQTFSDSKDPALQEQVANALFYKAFTLGDIGRFEEAIEAYDEVVKRFADCQEPELLALAASALVYKGTAFYNIGRFQQAEEAIRQGIELDPKSTASSVELIELLLTDRKRHTDAIHEAEAIINKNPSDTKLLNGVAWAFYRQNTPSLLQRSEVWARRAVSLVPDDSCTHHTLACILSALGKGQEALEFTKNYIADAVVVEKTVEDAIELFTLLAATGYAQEALELLVSSPAAKHLEPLVVGLRLFLGENVRTAVEILEVAKDVVTRIEERRKNRNPRIPSLLRYIRRWIVGYYP